MRWTHEKFLEKKRCDVFSRRLAPSPNHVHYNLFWDVASLAVARAARSLSPSQWPRGSVGRLGPRSDKTEEVGSLSAVDMATLM